MPKGRPRILDETKQLRGTDQPCRIQKKTVKPEQITDISQVQKFIGISKRILPTKRARDIFASKANQLQALGVLTELDLEQLALYAVSVDFAFSCIKKLKEPPIPRHDKDGEVIGYVTRPEVDMCRKAIEQSNLIGTQFGFTPLSRQRIATRENTEKNEWDQLADKINEKG
ncbi:hypothetical protein EZS27_015912 [termite gut metagenome]|uniref:Phage terminase small subunit P27 family n=1 Tax=termite gut metagenome TaxID=433724 RepID=A0A5J4RRG9_9ZZZZ